MQESALSTIVLPVALGIIMLGLGLSLTVADFTRVIKFPKAVFIGLMCQMLILPFGAFIIAKGLGLAPEFAVGLMLLAASPGGATANLFSHLSNGDVALNITLTAINSVLTLFTLPFIVSTSMDYFMGSAQAIPMPFDKIIQVFAIVLIPVSIGMLVKKYNPTLTTKLEKPVRIASAILLVLVIVAAILKEKENIGSYFAQVGLAALAFNLLSMLSGYFIPRLFKINNRQSIAIGMEIGIHNGTLAIFLALTVLNNQAMSIPPLYIALSCFLPPVYLAI
ncbi:MAG: bile acid:sodium symporter family protein [Sphingobacteriales bacterium JAD_PAG50586_3]|nr:MAG: bile acid:sodium symporter family protein [Sphingobacteriales bacterium JAD_PAG50586_3]